MADEIGRKSLEQLIQLQINLLSAYQELLNSPKWGEAKGHINNAIKDALQAVGPFLTVQATAASKAGELHRQAVAQTLQLLEDLKKEEKDRANIHGQMRAEAERKRAETERKREAERSGQQP